ncbi:MAG TPA: hypothetical protein DCY03_31265, partial [Planctomycetaceae bacterium]|nr:hypothetical protein [Planctomycetaceae bacterium]
VIDNPGRIINRHEPERKGLRVHAESQYAQNQAVSQMWSHLDLRPSVSFTISLRSFADQVGRRS